VTAGAAITYKPPGVPIVFSIDSEGNIGAELSTEIVTPLGTFGIAGIGEMDLAPDQYLVAIGILPATEYQTFTLRSKETLKIRVVGSTEEILEFSDRRAVIQVSRDAQIEVNNLGRGGSAQPIDGCDGAWVTVLGSTKGETKTPSQFLEDRRAELGDPSLSLIDNATCPSLTPGWYAVVGGRHARKDEAVAECIARGLTTRHDCFAAPLTGDPVDRFDRAYPD
jgi:hypothetical protein